MVDKLELTTQIKEVKFGSHSDAASKVREWYKTIYDGLYNADAQRPIPKGIKAHQALIRRRKAAAARQFMFS